MIICNPRRRINTPKQMISDWLAGCLAGWLAGWLAGCLAGWLGGYLAAGMVIGVDICIGIQYINNSLSEWSLVWLLAA